MNVEAHLREDAGPEFAGKLHTARSRNDQVATDTKMHLRSRILDIQEALAGLQNVLLARAEGHENTVMPGYTHTQHAQPISLSFWLSSYASAFTRDQRRLGNAFEIVNQSPLWPAPASRQTGNLPPNCWASTAATSTLLMPSARATGLWRHLRPWRC